MTNERGSAEQQLGDAQLLDGGREAEIYEWGDGRVLRLLRAEQAARGRTVDAEAAAMRSAAAAGVPVPAVHEVITVDGRPGLVMDRVDGPPMLSTMLKQPWRAFTLSRRFGAMQAALHDQTAPAEMMNIQAAVGPQLDRLESGDESLRQWAQDQLASLPAGDSLLHGDFHLINVLMGAGGPQIIDWPGATSGPAEADVARTMVLIEAGQPPGASWVLRQFLGIFRTRIFMPGYLRGYRKRRDLDLEVLHRWRLVRVIQRLVDGPTEEQATLRRLIRESGGPRDFGPA